MWNVLEKSAWDKISCLRWGNCQENEGSKKIKINNAVSKGRLDLTENLINDVVKLPEKIFPQYKGRIKNIKEKDGKYRRDNDPY